MGVRKMGVEEELLLVDPTTGRLTAAAARALRAHQNQGDDAGEVQPEFFRQQLETMTKPCATLDDLAVQLRSGRRTVTKLADQVGAVAVAVPAPVLGVDADDDITRAPRYQRIRDEFGELARTALVCAMHVHVEVGGADEGVRALDAARPWLPVLVAMSGNSPYFRGRDSGYASWRTHVWTRWPTTGTGEAFGSAAVYGEVRQALRQWGAALDDDMVYFDARLSTHFPTLEVRVADVCTDLDDAVLVAALTRALISTMAEDTAEPTSSRWRSDLLRAATWRASRYGLAGRLVHPEWMQLAPARTVLEALVARVRPALEEAGDLEVVRGLLERLLTRGGGAARQRQVFEERGTLEDVVADLAERTAG